jgi:phenylpropionate dioxygenase-like ring-hydroxylating dioxygenase large terminal subunit
MGNAIKKMNGRVVTTLASLSSSQQDAIRKIPAESDALLSPLKASRPNEIFTGQRRFDIEQDKIFKRFPVPVTVSALLKPGSTIAHNGYGLPLLISRTSSGEIKAMINACQHKGAKLIEDCEVHNKNRLTCPYHAWTYGIDGQLIGVARSDAFLDLDKSQRNLVQLEAKEWGGIVYVQLDRTQAADWSHLHPQISEDFEALGLPDMHVYGRKSFDLKANWKVVLEPFLEGYHVQRLHAQSIGDQFQDAPTVEDLFGVNIRQISGRIGYTPDMLDADPLENVHKLVTHAYVAFPSCVLVTSQYYTSIMLLIPQAPDRTQVDYFMLTPDEGATDKAKEVFERSYEMILNVFGNEDFRAAEICQTGLSAGVPSHTVYCGLEKCIVKYYDALEALL